MLGAEYYFPLYILIVTILTLIATHNYIRRPKIFFEKEPSLYLDPFALFLSIILAITIGLRPISSRYFGDTANYDFIYNQFAGIQFHYDPTTTNVIWDNLFCWWASERLGISSLFVFIAFIYFGCTLLSCSKLLGRDQYIAFLTFLGSFSTFSYATNGIKAGAAAAIFLLGISFYKNWIISAIFVLISLGFHHSMIIPVTALLLARIYKNSKTYFILWAICLFISAAHITFFQSLFASLAADNGDTNAVEYLQSSTSNAWGGKSGFRLDFVIYSAAPLLIGYWALFKKRIKISKEYSIILNTYLIANSIWLLCMYAKFNNRIAYLSWFMLPILLVYPLIKANFGSYRYSTLSKVVLANLGFTLFIEIIYYSIT